MRDYNPSVSAARETSGESRLRGCIDYSEIASLQIQFYRSSIWFLFHVSYIASLPLAGRVLLALFSCREAEKSVNPIGRPRQNYQQTFETWNVLIARRIHDWHAWTFQCAPNTSLSKWITGRSLQEYFQLYLSTISPLYSTILPALYPRCMSVMPHEMGHVGQLFAVIARSYRFARHLGRFARAFPLPIYRLVTLRSTYTHPLWLVGYVTLPIDLTASLQLPLFLPPSPTPPLLARYLHANCYNTGDRSIRRAITPRSRNRIRPACQTLRCGLPACFPESSSRASPRRMHPVLRPACVRSLP